MTWNYDIEQAPRGTYDEVKCGKNGTRMVHRPESIFLACKSGGVVTISRWIPDEGRWNMLAKGESPLAWMAFPKHPEAAE